VLKLLLEAGPLIAFLAVYAWRGIFDATAALVVLSVVALFLGRWIEGRWSPLSLFTVTVSVILGGLTVFYRDASFIMIKPTVVFGVFAIGLGGSHFIGDKVIYERLFGGAVQLPDRVWRRINALWAAYFAVHAVLNLWVATTYSESTWVIWKVFGFGLITVLFGLAHLPVVLHYRARTPAT